MEKSSSVDQERAQILRRLDEIIQSGSADLTQQGVIVPSWRVYRGRRLGPYYRITFRDKKGRQKSIYLGKDTELLEQVRVKLHDLQKCHRQSREYQKIRKQVKRSLALTKADLKHELQKAGLRLQGYAVRGWRNRSGQAN